MGRVVNTFLGVVCGREGLTSIKILLSIWTACRRGGRSVLVVGTGPANTASLRRRWMPCLRSREAFALFVALIQTTSGQWTTIIHAVLGRNLVVGVFEGYSATGVTQPLVL